MLLPLIALHDNTTYNFGKYTSTCTLLTRGYMYIYNQTATSKIKYTNKTYNYVNYVTLYLTFLSGFEIANNFIAGMLNCDVKMKM